MGEVENTKNPRERDERRHRNKEKADQDEQGYMKVVIDEVVEGKARVESQIRKPAESGSENPIGTEKRTKQPSFPFLPGYSASRAESDHHPSGNA